MKREDKVKPTKLEQAAQLWADFRSFLYTKEGDEPALVMGRTAVSWGKVGLFFMVYYACLAAFFAAMFAIAFSTMPKEKDGPKYTSLLADMPLLLVWPSGGVGSYKTESIEGIKNSYLRYLGAYNDTQCYLREKCVAGGDYRAESEEKQCGFDLSSLGPCNPKNYTASFGYEEGSPCLYFRLSKIYDWKPEPSRNSGKFVGLECDGDGDAKFKYFPDKEEAFPISFWPFRGESVWRAPIAAVQVSVNKTVKIKCHAIADNIERSDTYKLKRGAHGQIEFDVSPRSKS